MTTPLLQPFAAVFDSFGLAQGCIHCAMRKQVKVFEVLREPFLCMQLRAIDRRRYDGDF